MQFAIKYSLDSNEGAVKKTRVSVANTWRALWIGHYGDNNINNRGGVDGDDLNNNARLAGIAKPSLGHFIFFCDQDQV